VNVEAIKSTTDISDSAAESVFEGRRDAYVTATTWVSTVADRLGFLSVAIVSSYQFRTGQSGTERLVLPHSIAHPFRCAIQ